MEPMFEVPGSLIVGVHITEEYVRGEKGPEYVKRSPNVTATSEVDEAKSIRVKQ